MLAVTEIAEATEGERKDIMDDHLPHRKMGEVELADALIRILDTGGALRLKYTSHTYQSIEGSIFKKHLYIVKSIIDLTDNFMKSLQYMNSYFPEVHKSYSRTIDYIVRTAEFMDYDILSAMHEKLAYNKTRADHKLENRMKEGGKKV
jgi:hypothetical protein